MLSSRSAVSPSSSTGTTGVARISRKHQTKRISERQCRRWQRLRNSMAERCCKFVDSRLRRCPPDRAGAVPYGQAGENALRFPHLAHRSAAVHKLHSAPQAARIEFDSGKGATFNRLPALAYSSRNLSKRPGPPQIARLARPPQRGPFACNAAAIMIARMKNEALPNGSMVTDDQLAAVISAAVARALAALDRAMDTRRYTKLRPGTAPFEETSMPR